MRLVTLQNMSSVGREEVPPPRGQFQNLPITRPTWSTCWTSLVSIPCHESSVHSAHNVSDPEVSTLNTLNNVQNSLFIPNLGRFFNRQPTYDLSPSQPPPLSRIPTVDETGELELKEAGSAEGEASLGPSIFGAPLSHSHSISSVLSDSHYAVLPHGVVLEGWSEEDKAELNDHVRHLLHSRKAGFKRSMRAFGKYVRTRKHHQPLLKPQL